jgi:cell pole-organizing protein PopZ
LIPAVAARDPPMSAAAKTHEPSMEEILASIRRIIADDQENGAQPGSRLNGLDAGDAMPADDVLDLADLRPEPAVTSLDRDFTGAGDMSFEEPEDTRPPAKAALPEPSPAAPDADTHANAHAEGRRTKPARAGG